MAVVEVLPGVCGFSTRIVANSDEMYNVTLEITSDCTHIKQLAEQLKEASALDELMRPINETTPYRLAGGCRTHAACPVPSAILKAIEVAAGMALPADVHMSIRKS
jgi:hypothetical protein